MRNYKFFVNSALISLQLFIIASISVKGVLGHWEVFPIASWSLFSHIPGELGVGAIEIISIDGQQLDAPIDFMSSPKSPSGRGSINAFYHIQSFVRETMAVPEGGSEQSRRIFQEHYLRPSGRRIVYRLCFRRIDPLAAWKERAFPCAEIARYESGT